ncbi:MAG: hypothetical protein M3Q23_11755 [Actinomycetota bacterium]|nr:hypothetical protein [Actinomycetota bacterium]
MFIDMVATPDTDSIGEVKCPRCMSHMVEKRAPFYLHGEYVGLFESLVCDICYYSLLTAAGYDKAMTEAREFGLVGPEEEIISETIEMLDTSYILESPPISSNMEDGSKKFGQSNEEIESDSITTVGELSILLKYSERKPSIRTEMLIK